MKNLSFQFGKSMVESLPFHPPKGLTSPHIQTILPFIFDQVGQVPPSNTLVFQMHDGDSLSCKMSTPPDWKPHQKTIVFIHGLGGSDASSYMIQMSRKCYRKGDRVMRVNLRGAGEGMHMAKRPYHGGVSTDVLQVIRTLNEQAPHSPIILVGYSLGGNVILKLLGELGDNAKNLVEKAIAICPPVDLSHTVELLSKSSNQLYQHYYVKKLKRFGSRWIGNHSIKSILDFDNVVTAQQWGYRDAADYYRQCSSKFFIPEIRHETHLVFAADDPFVDCSSVLQNGSLPHVKMWISPHGGHMGFWGWAGREHGYRWLDALLLKLIHAEDSGANS